MKKLIVLNKEIFKLIKKEKAYKASADLAKDYGEPETLKVIEEEIQLFGYCTDNISAFILGQVSQGIEPYMSNAFVKDVDKMKVTIKNPALVELLEAKGQNTPEIWGSIRDNDGSVQST
ncbi:MAG: hypothetical protein R3B65_01200 [Candidatus Paceibacterota bacterium]